MVNTLKVSLMIDDAKVQKIIMQTKQFNSYFSTFLEMLKCKILFYFLVASNPQSIRFDRAIWKILPNFHQNSR